MLRIAPELTCAMLPLCADCGETAGIAVIVPPMLELPDDLDPWPPSADPKFLVVLGTDRRWHAFTPLFEQVVAVIDAQDPGSLYALEPTFAPWWCAARRAPYCAVHR